MSVILEQCGYNFCLDLSVACSGYKNLSLCGGLAEVEIEYIIVLLDLLISADNLVLTVFVDDQVNLLEVTLVDSDDIDIVTDSEWYCLIIYF